MSTLAPLIEIQEIDLAADAARRRSEELPERQSLPAIEAEIRQLEASLASIGEDQRRQESVEEELGTQVAQIARDIEAAELKRYSGGHMDRAASQAHDESQALLREQQAALEQHALACLEALEALEDRSGGLETTVSTQRPETKRLREVIAKVETEVAAQLTSLDESRMGLAPKIPDAILAAYQHVRGQPRSVGRGAALLEEGSCRGCRIKLPSVERSRMLAEPENALIQCPQCRRVLVR